MPETLVQLDGWIDRTEGAPDGAPSALNSRKVVRYDRRFIGSVRPYAFPSRVTLKRTRKLNT